VLKNGAFLSQEINTLLTNYFQSGLPVPHQSPLENSLLALVFLLVFQSGLPVPHQSPAPWELVCDYRFGGYAKVTRELLHFTEEFRQTQGISLDVLWSDRFITARILSQGRSLVVSSYWGIAVIFSKHK
jgi:1-aminocyclopropane-1-carboxylate deaminase